MKRNSILLTAAFLAFIVVPLTAKFNVHAAPTAYVTMVDGSIYPPDTSGDNYYSYDESHKSNNLMTMFKDFVGADIIEEKWNEFVDNAALKWGMRKSQVGLYVTSYLDIFNFLEKEIDEDKTANEAIEEWGARQMEKMSPLYRIKTKALDIGQKLSDSGKTVSDSTAAQIKKRNEQMAAADAYFAEYPEQKDSIQKQISQITAANSGTADTAANGDSGNGGLIADALGVDGVISEEDIAAGAYDEELNGENAAASGTGTTSGGNGAKSGGLTQEEPRIDGHGKIVSSYKHYNYVNTKAIIYTYEDGYQVVKSYVENPYNSPFVEDQYIIPRTDFCDGVLDADNNGIDDRDPWNSCGYTDLNHNCIVDGVSTKSGMISEPEVKHLGTCEHGVVDGFEICQHAECVALRERLSGAVIY